MNPLPSSATPPISFWRSMRPGRLQRKILEGFSPYADFPQCHYRSLRHPWDDSTLLEEVKQLNLELQRRDGVKRHFSFDWQAVAAFNPAYRAAAEQELERLGRLIPGGSPSTPSRLSPRRPSLFPRPTGATHGHPLPLATAPMAKPTSPARPRWRGRKRKHSFVIPEGRSHIRNLPAGRTWFLVLHDRTVLVIAEVTLICPPFGRESNPLMFPLLRGRGLGEGGNPQPSSGPSIKVVAHYSWTGIKHPPLPGTRPYPQGPLGLPLHRGGRHRRRRRRGFVPS